jgi:hypothetical protein
MLKSSVDWMSRVRLMRTMQQRLQMADELTCVAMLEASALVATVPMHSLMLLPLQPQLDQEDAGSKI